MKISKKHILLLIVFIFNFLQLKSLTTSNIDNKNCNYLLDSIINTVKLKYAPDSRISIFEISYHYNKNKHLVLSGKTNHPLAILELKENLIEKKIDYIDSTRIIPDLEMNKKLYGVVNNSVSNHRSKPFYTAELTTQALLGMPLNILEKQGNWCRVQTPDNTISWVDNGGITLMNKSEINDWLNCRKIVYWKDAGNSYEKPNTNSQKVSDLVICNVLRYIKRQGKFILVAYPDGRQAYIKDSECRDYDVWLNDDIPTPNDIIDIAKNFMGIPYLWGGTSSKGLDCSGFTKMTFLVSGIILQRDASQQVKYGEKSSIKKDFENLKPGNLLFFGENEKITHVALYIGNQKYIHASGNVSINSFNSKDFDFSLNRYNSFITSSDYIKKIGSDGIVKIKDCEFYKIRK